MPLPGNDPDVAELERLLRTVELEAGRLRTVRFACTQDFLPDLASVMLRERVKMAGRLAVAAGQAQALVIKLQVRMEGDDDGPDSGAGEPGGR